MKKIMEKHDVEGTINFYKDMQKYPELKFE